MFEIREVETRMLAGLSHERRTRYVVEAQQCDLAARVAEEMMARFQAMFK